MPRTPRPSGIAVLLGVGVLVNYFDRVNLSVAHDALQLKFGMSDVVFGYLLSSYNWTYAAMQLPCGALLDRFGVRKVMLTAILLWALAAGLSSVAPTVALLFASRFLLGIGEAPTFPANAKAIGLWFPARKRGLPTATFDAAAKFAPGIGTPILGLILLHYGLRANFATTAIVSLLYAGLFYLVYRDPDPLQTIREEEAVPLPTQPATISDLLRQPKILAAALGSGAYNFTFYLLLTWMPVFLQRGLNLTPRDAVLLSAVPWLVAGVTGLGVGGLLVDRLIAQGRSSSAVRRAVLIIGTSFGLFVLAPALFHQPRLVLICLTLAVSGLAAASPVVWTLPSLLAPPGTTGRVGAIMNFAGQIAGISAPILTGYISGATHSFRGAFLLAGAILSVGIAAYIFLLGRIERVRLPSELTA